MNHLIQKRITLLLFLCTAVSALSQTTLNYDLGSDSYFTKFTDGGNADAVATGGQLRMYANGSGNRQVVVWRDFKTAGDNTGTVRPLQVGDVFTLSVNCSSAGQIGFSLNAGNVTGSWDNRTANSRLYIREDGTSGSWYVNSAAGNQSLEAYTGNVAKDYVFKVSITSYTTCNVALTINGTITQTLNNLTMNGAAGVNISGFSLYLTDDFNGTTNADVYWKQTTQVQASAEVRLGYGLTSGSFTPGRIINGFEANSTSTVSVNNVLIGGGLGSKVVLNEPTNNYHGSTTINTNANCELLLSNTLNGPLTINGGGALTFNSPAGIAISNSLILNGFGQGGLNGAIRHIGGAFAGIGGPITLGSDSMIQSDGGGPLNIFTSTINLGSHTLTFSGTQNTYCSHAVSGTGGIIKTGSGELAFGNTPNNYSGGTVIMEGTLIPLTFSAFGTGAITAPSGSNGTLGTNYPFENPIVVSAGGKLTFTAFDIGLVTSLVSGSGSIGIDVPERLVLVGTNPFSGTFNITQGTLLQGTGTPLGTAHINIGKNNDGIDQTHDATLAYGNISNNITVAANLGFYRDIVSDFFEGPIFGTIQLDGDVRFRGVGNKIISGSISGTGGITALQGTTTLNAENTYTGDTVIADGAHLAFAYSSAIPSESKLIMQGGTLTTNNFSTAMGSLSVQGDATIALGSFLHFLFVGNSTANPWSGTLTITGWGGPSAQQSPFGGHIIVGMGGLTAEQLQQITFSGYPGHAIILPSGELAPAGTPVSLKLFIEGYYDAGAMRPVRFNQDGFSDLTDTDYVRVELHEATAPHNIVYFTYALLKTDGTLDLGRVYVNGSFYIAVGGNNFITTWSAAPVAFGTTPVLYDFSASASMAYGDNMIQLEPGVYGFYSGDIDQDGLIDTVDYSLWETDANNFAFGPYQTDLNGDGLVDAADYSVWESNNNNFVMAYRP